MFVLMKSQTCLKMGKVRSNTRSIGQILKKPCVRSKGHIFSQIIMKLGQNVCFDKSFDEFCVGSKTRSLGQSLEKPYVHSKGHIFSLIIMKRGQNVCLNEILDKFGNGSCWVKKRSLDQM